MELRRTIYTKLLEWKELDTGRVLELRGSRSAGKTYTLKKFGNENFSRMIYISMAGDSGKKFLKFLRMADELQESVPVENVVYRAINLLVPSFIDNKETIIIIDEIQESSRIYNIIPILAQEFQSYVIVASSYPGRMACVDFDISESTMDYMKMEPLTCEEFLDVIDESKKCENYYELYRMVGGYPSVVACYVEQRDLNKCDDKINALLEAFMSESQRYCDNDINVRLLMKVLNAIALLTICKKDDEEDWLELLRETIYKQEFECVSYRIIDKVISWLQESYIIGCVPEEKNRIYYLDMGIAHYFLHRTGEVPERVNQLLDENYQYLVSKKDNIHGNEISLSSILFGNMIQYK